MQIIAMGGGGFSMEPDNLALDRYVLDQCGSDRPKVCFLPTASAEAEAYVVKFYRAFTALGAVPTDCSLFRLPQEGLRSALFGQDVIYVGGGNTRSMLALWREWGLDEILWEAAEDGAILAGLSAGAICWFEQGVTDSNPGGLSVLNCFGYLSGSCCPHYDGESERRPTYRRMVADGRIRPGLALDDGVAGHYVDGRLVHLVSSRPDARAYQVTMGPDGVDELPVEPKFLGQP